MKQAKPTQSKIQAYKSAWYFAHKTQTRTKSIQKAREYYKNNKEKCLKSSRNWKNSHKDYLKQYYKKTWLKRKNRAYWYNLLRKYGMTEVEYNKILNNQNGVCCICKNKQKAPNRILVIDHNHNTNKIRGLLCNNCNVGIGLLNDSIIIMKRAIKYLERNKDEKEN